MSTADSRNSCPPSTSALPEAVVWVIYPPACLFERKQMRVFMVLLFTGTHVPRTRFAPGLYPPSHQRSPWRPSSHDRNFSSILCCGQRAVLATEPRAHFPAKGEATGEQTFFFLITWTFLEQFEVHRNSSGSSTDFSYAPTPDRHSLLHRHCPAPVVPLLQT